MVRFVSLFNFTEKGIGNTPTRSRGRGVYQGCEDGGEGGRVVLDGGHMTGWWCWKRRTSRRRWGCC